MSIYGMISDETKKVIEEIERREGTQFELEASSADSVSVHAMGCTSVARFDVPADDDVLRKSIGRKIRWIIGLYNYQMN